MRCRLLRTRRRRRDRVDDAKLHVPSSRTDWIQRRRLISTLEQAALSPIVLVAAPAGYGKSTAVGQWLQSENAPEHQAWVSLDEGDNDATRMWVHLAAALDRAGCDLGAGPAEYVAKHAAALATRVVPWVTAAIQQLAEPLVLVLDDCHLLPAGPATEQLQALLDHLPDNAHVILVCRSDPALRLGRLRVAGRLIEIRTADLAFDPGETGMLLRSEGVVPSRFGGDRFGRAHGGLAGRGLSRRPVLAGPLRPGRLHQTAEW